jgi:hypothetical protein
MTPYSRSWNQGLPMRGLTRIFLAIFSLLCAAAPARGQPYDYLGLYVGNCADRVVSLTVELGLVTGLPEGLHSLRIVRRTPADCGTPVVVATEVLENAPGEYVFQYDDTVPRADNAYEYRLLGTTESGDLFDLDGAFELPRTFDYGVCGRAVVSRGQVYDYGWAGWVQPCENTCYLGAFIEDYTYGQLDPYYGTGITVDLIGWVECGTLEGCIIQAFWAEPTDCLAVSTEAVTCGAFKARF